jgi:Alkaline phosphatase
MNKDFKRQAPKTKVPYFGIYLIIIITIFLTACSQNDNTSQTSQTEIQAENATETPGATLSLGNTPKYVFLFIGDGMGYPQIQSAAYYLGAKENNEVKSNDLSFMSFPVAGSAKTYDSTSFAPDSASTATSIATGNKTHSGTINMDTSMTESFETITEKLKAQKDYKIGIVTSVNLNHATPAAFYAHQPSRGNLYEISEELIASDFDYFAGGALLSPTGREEKQRDIYEVAIDAGYKVIRKDIEAKALTPSDGKVIVIAEQLADNDAMAYQIDKNEENLFLADYVKKGIEILDNKNGFFMMVEAGKIDWACHANDAAASIYDSIAFDNAIAEALAFYNEHPDDTLILVTGDHETGGMSIGYAGLDYDTYLKNLENQKISYAQFDTHFVADYKEHNVPFSSVLEDVKEQFGLITASSNEDDLPLVLSDYEYKLLETAYERTLQVGPRSKDEMSQEEYLLYGSYEPLTVTITHILNNKSGINFSSYAHTGLPVPVFAKGIGQDNFSGFYDNTDIYKNMAEILGVE